MTIVTVACLEDGDIDLADLKKKGTINVGLLVAFATRPAPRTTGIVEPSPIERVRLEQEALRRAESARERSPAPTPSGKTSEHAAPKS